MKRIAYRLKYIGSKPIKVPYEASMIKPGEYITNPNVDRCDDEDSDYEEVSEYDDLWGTYTEEEVNSIKSIGGLLCPAEFEDEEDLFIPISDLKLYRRIASYTVRDKAIDF